jgi:hypothetical protein
MIATSSARAQEQTATRLPAVEAGKAKAKSNDLTMTSATSASPSATPTAPEGKLARWLELQTVTLSARYRYSDTSAGVTTANLLSHKEAVEGRFKFDRQGNYSLNAGLFTGRQFNSSWDNEGWGTGKGQTNLALKQLYFAAKPVKGLELQYGGLYIIRGESTDITTYDSDAYIVGERISLKRPDKLFFDEVSITYAYLGDLDTPNINKRYYRLKQSNYHQFLVVKKINQRAAVSADYTFQWGRDTLHQAIRLSLPELRVLDTIRFENYQRTDPNPAYGFALYGEKTVAKRLTLGGGSGQIDPRYGSGLNSDPFDIGKRLFLSGSFQISPEFSVSGFVGPAVANGVPLPQRNRIHLVFSYELLKTLQRTGLF